MPFDRDRKLQEVVIEINRKGESRDNYRLAIWQSLMKTLNVRLKKNLLLPEKETYKTCMCKDRMVHRSIEHPELDGLLDGSQLGDNILIILLVDVGDDVAY